MSPLSTHPSDVLKVVVALAVLALVLTLLDR